MRFSPVSGTTSATVPIATSFRNDCRMRRSLSCGQPSVCSKAWASLKATPTPHRFFSGYGQPGYSGPVQPAATAGGQDRTQIFGIIGMIVGLICCPIVGIVLGVLSLRDAKRYNNSPTLGYLAIALSVVGIAWSLAISLAWR